MFCSPYKVGDITDLKVVKELATILDKGEVAAGISCGVGPNGHDCLVVKTPVQLVYIYSGDTIQAGEGVIVICGSKYRR